MQGKQPRWLCENECSEEENSKCRDAETEVCLYVCGRARSSWLVTDEFGEINGREVTECSLKDYSNGFMLRDRVMRSH